jgi:glyoxylase-like metal-dependent hydrolase (beta-lactamase superfamily II)
MSRSLDFVDRAEVRVTRVVEIAPGVHRVAVAPRDSVNVFLVADEQGALTLVDAGWRNAPRHVLAALGELGREPRDLEHIVITHAHHDHTGGLAALVAETGADVAVHERDAVHVRTGRPPRNAGGGRIGRAADRVHYGRFTGVDVDREFADGELLKAGGGLRVVHTPGHTPGHSSLLHEPTGTLFVGDTVFNLRRIDWPWQFFCTDPSLNHRTATRLCDLEFEVAAFAHGPEIREGAREAVCAFLRDQP